MNLALLRLTFQGEDEEMIRKAQIKQAYIREALLANTRAPAFMLLGGGVPPGAPRNPHNQGSTVGNL